MQFSATKLFNQFRYRVKLPGGEVKEGNLNSYGQAGFYELDPGSCKVTFPELDEEAWERN